MLQQVTPIQTPLLSGFDAATTAAEVMAGIDLTGRTAIVTGGYSGLGQEAVRVMAQAGARVIVPARDEARARERLAAIPNVEVWAMDLGDKRTIDRFAERFLAERRALDILMLSAGIMALPELQRDERGLELQFAVNHIGHFALTGRLWPALSAAGNARVVALSSRGHRFSPVRFDDLAFARCAYDRWAAYGQSKTANALFALELDRRGREAGVRAFSVHPGGIVTNLAQHLSAEELQTFGALDAAGQPVIDPYRGKKSVAQGAATQVWCAVHPRLDGLGGLYCEDVDVAGLADAELSATDVGGGGRGVAEHAVDPVAATRLWIVSEALIGVKFPVVAAR
ncbi:MULTISPECIES: oxidoreductase [unclassified Achromobacter]|uniref:oxidoreductase n=1 Tax=unclassified Achromobacter TaxID=2626865 RepID=UPI000B51D0BE|nr:oxidoreductase [Achromobacter sp. HZ34]OWT82118.1 oxidoreductase [Achromobacter sp. HZ28]